MRTRLSLLWAIATALALAGPARANPTSLHFPLEEGAGFEARDAVSGQAYALSHVFERARYKPATDPYWRTDCIVGDCLLFDGYSNVIEGPGLAAGPIGDGIVVSAWVAPHAFEWGDGNRYSAVVSQWAGSEGIVFGVYRHGTWGLRLGFGDGNHIDVRSQGHRLPRDAWSHIAARYDAASRHVELYLDGERIAAVELPSTDPVRLPGVPLRIGKHSTPHGVAGIFDFNTFCGLLDEVRIERTSMPDRPFGDQVRAALSKHGGTPPTIDRPMVEIDRATFAGDQHRPQYHLMPDAHWMNEPHAPFYYNGKYHLFYQKNPHGPFWHQIHWGHWVSEDLVHWKELPMALFPEDNGVAPDGMWSGSASYDANGEPVLFFTAGNDSTYPKERTGLAVAKDPDDENLIEWEIYPQPVTLQKRSQGVWGQFRDPFVWRQDAPDGTPRWFQLVTSGVPSGSGTALLFESTDLTKWTYHGPFYTTNPRKYGYTGAIWELPVFLPLGTGRDGRERWVFTFNAAGRGAVREAYYWIGTWDPEQPEFIADHEAPRHFDLGKDHFTGPSGFVDPKTGRSIVFSIAQGERTPQGEWQSGWAHNAGLPIQLWLGDDDTLRVRPIEELERLRDPPFVDVSNTTLGEVNEILAAFSGDLFELVLRVRTEALKGQPVAVRFRATPDDDEHTDLRWDPARQRLEIDRTHHTLDPDQRGRGVDGGPVPGVSEMVELRLFVDRSMVEAYLNERRSLTSRVFPARFDATGLRLRGAEGLRIESFTVWPMRSAFPDATATSPTATGVGFDPTTAFESGLPNHDFASCDLTGWTVLRGRAFRDRAVTAYDVFWGGIFFNPSRRIPGTCHYWGFRARGADRATGAMRSTDFVLGGDGQINFLLSGGRDLNRLYIALVRSSDGSVLRKATGINYEEYQRVFWDASEHVGEQLHLLVVDDAQGGWGHLNLDDIHVPVERLVTEAP